MSGARNAAFGNLLSRSLRRLLWLLSLGLLGNFRGSYTSLKSPSKRFEFIADYALLSLFLAMIFSGAYRLLLYFDLLGGFHYYMRKAIFTAFMAPSLYVLFLGECRRLNDMGLWRGLIVLNFVPTYGFAGLLLVLALCPRLAGR